MDTIRRFFSAPIFENDEDKTRRARLLHIILVAQTYVLLFVLLATLFTNVSERKSFGTDVFVTTGGLFLIVFWRFLIWRGQVSVASIGMIFFFTLSVTMILMAGGTIRSTGVVYYPLVVVMATLLVNRRAGVIFFILTIFVGVGLIEGEMHGFFSIPENATTPAAHAIFISGMGLTLVLLYLATQGVEEALRRSAQNEQAVRLLASTLEQRVQERTRAAEQARAEAETARRTTEAQSWSTRGQAQLAERLRGDPDIPTLANNVIAFLCKYLGAHTGALFLVSGDLLKLTGRYAYTEMGQKSEFHLGEGLVGESAKSNRVISTADIPADTLWVSSALGAAKPKQLLIAPIGMEGKVLGVVELAALERFSAEQETFLQNVSESIAIAFRTAQARMQINELLLQSQQQAEELKAQEEELRAANEELQAQAERYENNARI